MRSCLSVVFYLIQVLFYRYMYNHFCNVRKNKIVFINYAKILISIFSISRFTFEINIILNTLYCTGFERLNAAFVFTDDKDFSAKSILETKKSLIDFD
jgi:hypothetical protein